MIAALLLNEGSKKIVRVSSNPYQESIDLLCHILEISRDKLRFDAETIILDNKQVDLFSSYIGRRLQNEPLAYILNQEFFWDRLFYIDNRALIPRPETEFLIEHLFDQSRTHDSVLDLCCGSGILGITCDLYFHNRITVQSDLSFNALEISSINNQRHNSNCHLIQGNLLQSFQNNSFDLIVCNPPYVTTSHKEVMTKDVLDFEPHLALFSENDGLQHIYQILESSQRILQIDGIMYMEIGIDQLSPIKNFLQATTLELIHTIFDFQSIPRIIILRKTHE